MTVSAIHGSAVASEDYKRRLPVPVVRETRGSQDRAGNRFVPSRFLPSQRQLLPLARPAAPFLAQLALQYDDIAVVRSQRQERMRQAARSYPGSGQVTSAAAGRRSNILA
jgi:hypothetical protein